MINILFQTKHHKFIQVFDPHPNGPNPWCTDNSRTSNTNIILLRTPTAAWAQCTEFTIIIMTSVTTIISQRITLFTWITKNQTWNPLIIQPDFYFLLMRAFCGSSVSWKLGLTTFRQARFQTPRNSCMYDCGWGEQNFLEELLF